MAPRGALRALRLDRFGPGASRRDALASPKPRKWALRARYGTRMDRFVTDIRNPGTTAVHRLPVRTQCLARSWKAYPMGHLWAAQHPLSSLEWARTGEIVYFWHACAVFVLTRNFLEFLSVSCWGWVRPTGRFTYTAAHRKEMGEILIFALKREVDFGAFAGVRSARPNASQEGCW